MTKQEIKQIIRTAMERNATEINNYGMCVTSEIFEKVAEDAATRISNIIELDKIFG